MSREVAWSTQEDDMLLKKINETKAEGREIHWVEVARYMARGRLTKIPRTGLECRTRYAHQKHQSLQSNLYLKLTLSCRYELLVNGGATRAQLDGAAPQIQLPVPQLQSHGVSSQGVSTLCMTPPEGFSDMESDDEGMDMDMITVPDTLVVPVELHI